MVNKVLRLTLPLQVYLPRKTKEDKKIILNLNNYRNAHYTALNKAKKAYERLVWLEYKQKYPKGAKFTVPVSIEYSYYHNNNGTVDLSNPISVIDKFACDALTKFGLWADDNSTNIPQITARFAGVDSKKPRCVMTIKPINNGL